jgi:hypothetical protein
VPKPISSGTSGLARLNISVCFSSRSGKDFGWLRLSVAIGVTSFPVNLDVAIDLV